MSTGLVYSHRYLQHGTGNHPENPGRLQAVVSHLQVTGLLDVLKLIDPREVDDEALLKVHDPGVLERVKSICASGGGYLDFDTVASGESYSIAKLAAGGVVGAIRAVMDGEVDNGMALVRPPGHHATRSRSMGFCLFNNIAVGAHYLIDEYGMERILVVDWDLHHGNGTQDIFYDSPRVFYLSIHQGNHYPGTGNPGETGTGAGEGYTLNRPLPAGTSEEDTLEAFSEALAEAVDRFDPQFVLVSAGFDAHRDDPLGELRLTESGFSELTRLVKRVASDHCEGRLVSTLEGGYHPDALAMSIQVHLEALLGI